MRPRLIPQRGSGLFSEHSGVDPGVRIVLATIPAVEALRAAGATVEPLGTADEPRYRVTLGPRMPDGLVGLGGTGPPYVHARLRLEIEPEWPDEYPDVWVAADWLPCPRCGAPVVWYEAGYVPGYRVCAGPKHHHSVVMTREPDR